MTGDRAEETVVVYHDVTTGEWTEAEGQSVRSRRVKAAERLGCDSSDLRRGYGHTDRVADDETAVVAEGLLQDALRGDDVE